MTTRHHGDCCPACGSYQVIPYAVLVGGSEEYGYQCLLCLVMWPVLAYGDATGPAIMASRKASPAS